MLGKFLGKVTGKSVEVVTATPEFFDTFTTKEGPYTYTEILTILATPEWTDPNPPF